MDWVTMRSRGKELVRKYRYVLLVVLAGLFLMALPDGKNTKAAPEPAAAETEPRQDLQTGLEEILSQIQGAGRVRVLLTQREGERTVYQTDEDSTSSGIRSDTVLLNGSDRSQTGLVQQVNPPTYLGAVIVCQGADSASVRLAIVSAVGSVTGLSTDKITVLKMKSMIGGIFMKVWKKNLIAAAILVTVCAGIYVNWRYTEDQAAANLTDTLDTEKVMSDDNLVLSEDMAAISAGEDVATTSTDYFAAVRLSRQQARDNAVNLLQEAMSYSESSKEAESAVELEQIVQTALSEAQIESLIIAKGYADCVAYMSGEGISIAVASPEGGLQREDVAVIADIVMAQSDYSLNDIRVVEVQ